MPFVRHIKTHSFWILCPSVSLRTADRAKMHATRAFTIWQPDVCMSSHLPPLASWDRVYKANFLLIFPWPVGVMVERLCLYWGPARGTNS